MREHTDLETTLQGLLRTTAALDSRVRRLEAAASFSQAGTPLPVEADRPDRPAEDPAGSIGSLELEVGERWLGPAGVAVLLVGVASFINHSFDSPSAQALQIAVGAAIAAAMAVLSRKWRAAYPFTARILLPASLVLLYLAVLRLHYFSPAPLIASRGVGLGLLAMVPCLGFWLAIRHQSQHLLVLAVFLAMATAPISDGDHVYLWIVAASSAATVWIGVRQRWRPAIITAMLLAYGCHLVWFFNNPLLGHPLRAVADHHYNLAYVFAYWILYSLGGLLDSTDDDVRTSDLVLVSGNCAALAFLGALVGWTHFRPYFEQIFLAIAIVCLAVASIYWARLKSTLTTAICACSGYMALTIAIVSHFPRAECFFWLAGQSLLVVTTAILFRSRIIVVANILIFLGILLAYLVSGPPLLLVSLSYAAVALLSARVMSWQKRRLALRTESMRNTYLVSAFAVIPYALYHGVPASYVSLSWVGAAGFYFLMSLVLNNRKYRWMAILTMALTVFYAFLVDFGRLDPTFRTVSLIVLGLALTVVSLLYARSRGRSGGSV